MDPDAQPNTWYYRGLERAGAAAASGPRAVLEALDGLLAHRGGAAPAACISGCAWCCHLPVSASVAEADLIVEHVERHFAPDEAARLHAAVTAESAVRLHLGRSGSAAARRPCPLLDGAGRYAVYAVRPAVCRGCSSSDAAACADDHAAAVGDPASASPMRPPGALPALPVPYDGAAWSAARGAQDVLAGTGGETGELAVLLAARWAARERSSTRRAIQGPSPPSRRPRTSCSRKP